MKKILGKGKKGISPVIATILLILITVAAVAIIWAAIIPMIRDNLTKITQGTDAQTQLEIDKTSGLTCVNGGADSCTALGAVTCGPAPTCVCTNTTVVPCDTTANKCTLVPASPEVRVKVKKNPGTVELSGVQIIVTLADGSSKSVRNNTLPMDSESKVYKIIGTDYIGAKKVEIAPWIKTGNTEEMGTTADNMDLPACI